MNLTVLEIQIDRDSSWVTVGQLGNNYQPSLLHLEYSYGRFKWDFLGINALAHYLVDKEWL